MNKVDIQLLIAFLMSFFAVGIPYWSVPYSEQTWLDTLIRPGLFVVGITAMLLRSCRITSFWNAVLIMSASVPAAVFARILADGIKDPTSHNMWPIELIYPFRLGFFYATGGAMVAHLFSGLRTPPIDTKQPSTPIMGGDVLYLALIRLLIVIVGLGMVAYGYKHFFDPGSGRGSSISIILGVVMLYYEVRGEIPDWLPAVALYTLGTDNYFSRVKMSSLTSP